MSVNEIRFCIREGLDKSLSGIMSEPFKYGTVVLLNDDWLHRILSFRL